LLDAALRRRFGFIELMPDYGALGPAMVGGLSLAAWLEALNLRLIKVLRATPATYRSATPTCSTAADRWTVCHGSRRCFGMI
jgi:hypothetical protein